MSTEREASPGMSAARTALLTETLLVGVEFLAKEGLELHEMAMIELPYALAFGCTYALAKWGLQQGHLPLVAACAAMMIVPSVASDPLSNSLEAYFKWQHETMTQPQPSKSVQPDTATDQPAKNHAYLHSNGEKLSYTLG